eukprot:1184328-Prorocentrum_minimum.AAC.1
MCALGVCVTFGHVVPGRCSNGPHAGCADGSVIHPMTNQIAPFALIPPRSDDVAFPGAAQSHAEA